MSSAASSPARAPVRVAVVLPSPAPYREGLLGALHARGNLDLRVVFLTAASPSWDAGADWFATEHPYPSLHLRALELARPGRTPIQWPRGLERALDAARPDVVVASEYGAAALRVHAWCARHGVPHLILTECTPEIDRLLPAPQLALHRGLARRVDGVIAVSAAGRARLEAFGVAPERIAVSTQPADVAAIRSAVAAAPAPEPPPVRVLTAGRLVPDKNLSMLIQAVARLGPSVRLRIAGTGFLDAELRTLADRLAAPVDFLGAVAPAAMASEYARAHVFALVSTFEPFGVVVREATAAGLPIVCSARAGAAGEVALAGRNALLVDPASLDDVTDALRRLVDDPALRSRMGAESRAIDQTLEGADVDAFAEAIARAVL